MSVVLCNVLNATSMKNQFAHVRQLLTANGYDTKVTSTISVFDIKREELDGVIVMTLFDPYFLVSSAPALIQYNGKKIIYVTIEGVPKKSSVLYSPLTRLEYIAVSKFVAKMLTKAGCKVRASVHHAINIDDSIKALQIAPKVRAKLKEKFPNEVLFLFVGRNDPRKGIVKLIQANNILKQEGLMNYRILVVSDPSIKNVLTDDRFVIVNPFGSMNHVQVLALMRAVDYVMLPSKCVPPDTLIPTIEGYKPICEIKEGDLVLTHRGRFRKVTKVFKRKYKGKLVCIKPRKYGRWIRLTPEHLVLARWRTPHWGHPSKWDKYEPMLDFKWIPAEKLTTNHVVCVPKVKDDKVVIDVMNYLDNVIEKDGFVYSKNKNQFGKEFIHPQSKPLPRMINPSDEFLELLGYYLAEGCSTKDGIYYAFSQFEQDKIERLKELGKHFNAKVTVKNLERHRSIQRFYHKLLGQLFEALCGKGARNKHIPLFLLQLPKEKLAILFHSMIAGDGYVNDFMSIVYSTVSERLALSTYLLATKLGYLPSLQDDTKWDHGYEIAFTPMRSYEIAKQDENYMYLPISEIKLEDYDGYVYNLEVEEDNSYVAEIIAVHNCEGFGLPVLEAMSVGTPTLHTWCPPFTEFSSDEFNFVWEYDTIQLVDTKMSQYFVMHEYDPLYLADSIKDAIDCYVNDHETYEEYRIKALEHAVKWDYRLLYTELLSLEKFKIDKNKAKEDYSRSIEKLSEITDYTINV